MTTDPEFDRTIADIRAKAEQVHHALRRITGTGTAGEGTVTAVVDAAGHLRDLRLTPAAYRHGDRLPGLILKATAAAENDAARQTHAAQQPLLQDPLLAEGIRAMDETLGLHTPAVAETPMSADEITAADDAYFERMNQQGWR